MSEMRGRDIGLTGEWADVEVHEWSEDDERRLQETKARAAQPGYDPYAYATNTNALHPHVVYLRSLVDDLNRLVDDLTDSAMEPWRLQGGTRGPTRSVTVGEVCDAIRRRNFAHMDVTPDLVAMDLDVSSSTLKRVLRDHGIRWSAARVLGR